ncbi:MAG: 30S ribosomal protein S20 [bacterium]|nr:30S ribosomal protein S20 [bacterium]
MPNKPSAKKALRQTEKRAEKNLRMKKHVKTLFKHAMEAIKASDMPKAKELSVTFQKIADKAVKTNVISTNMGRRKKSTLMKAISMPSKKEAV